MVKSSPFQGGVPGSIPGGVTIQNNAVRLEIKMLKEQITKDIIQAMKDKDNVKKGTLQLVKGNIENLEIEKKRALKQTEEIQVIQREIKQTKEALADAERYGRSDLVEMNKTKLEILSEYLPEQLGEDEVREVLVSLGIDKGMNMGQAMKLAMPKLSGKTDNALISKLVRELIA